MPHEAEDVHELRGGDAEKVEETRVVILATPEHVQAELVDPPRLQPDTACAHEHGKQVDWQARLEPRWGRAVVHGHGQVKFN